MAVALLALFVALGGTGYAASQLGHRSAVVAKKKKPKTPSLRGPKGDTGDRGIQGPGGTNGTNGANGVNGANGTNGAPGTARAYGYVAKNGTLSRSKNVTGVTEPTTAEYCIALDPSIVAAQTGLVATLDLPNDDTNFGANQPQAFVEWISSAGDCSPGQLEVETGVRTVTTAADPQGGATFVNAVRNDSAQEPFFFVVP
jgi:hypothetical protein